MALKLLQLEFTLFQYDIHCLCSDKCQIFRLEVKLHFHDNDLIHSSLNLVRI